MPIKRMRVPSKNLAVNNTVGKTALSRTPKVDAITASKIPVLFKSLSTTPQSSPIVNDKHIDFYENMGVELRKSLDNLYEDLLAEQSVETPVTDSLSQWRTISDSTLSKYDNDLNIKNVFIEATIAYRKYGHVLIIPILVDSEETKIPLGSSLESMLPRKPKIKKLLVVDEFEPSDKKVADILSDHYGKHVSYRINDKPIHHSRVIVMGKHEEKSFLQKLGYYHNDFHDRNFETTRAMKESNLLILSTDFEKLEENIRASADVDMLSNPLYLQNMVTEVIENRARNLRANANNENSYIVDKNTEAVKSIEKTFIKQMSDTTKESLRLYCAAVDIPASRFLGEASTGLYGNVADLSNYVQTLNGYRAMKIESPLKELDNFIKILDGNVSNLDFEWNRLAIQQDNETDDNPVNTISDEDE